MKKFSHQLSILLCVLTAIILLATPLSSMKLGSFTSEETRIQISDTSITIHLWEEIDQTGDSIPYYTIYDKGIPKRTTATSYQLGLRYNFFDPLITTPDIPQLLQSGDDTHLYIVQFFTQPLVEYQDVITSLGGNIYHYVAQNALLVELSDTQLPQLNELPFIRWIGPYHPAYRLEDYLVDNFENADQIYPQERYNILVHSPENKNPVINKLITEEWGSSPFDAGKKLVRATLTYTQLFELIRWDEILFVDRWGPMEVDMDIVREIGGANYIEMVAGYTGEGVRGESFDTGFNQDHIDFASRPLIVHGDTVPIDSHGTACIGICFGDGTGNPDARGLLPDGQGIVAYYDDIGLYGPNRYTHTGELVQEPYNAVFQTASVGSPRCLDYSTISAESDQAIFDFDIVLCQSQSNAGNQMSRPQAWAKNMVSGGGIRHYDTLNRSDDMWDYGASIGPASDGRVKPTLIGFYDDILTVGCPGTNDYTYTFGGTSGATPIIAGHIGLFFQMWSDGIFGNTVNPSGTVFENKAHFTTAKAALINTAYQYPFNGTSHDKTRMHQGWGMPDLKKLYDIREQCFVVDEDDILEPFANATYIVTVNEDQPELKITLSYADPPGNPAVQSQHRINDLTLQVIAPDGTIYWGNYGLMTGVWSVPNGTADTLNTVENVFVKDPQPGTWTIIVSADEIIQDSHVETPEMDADFALVISGINKFRDPPYGPTYGDCGIPHEFYYDIPEDLGNESVFVRWDWDDSSCSEWSGPYTAGETVTAIHTYILSGYYGIRTQLRDTSSNESAWSRSWTFSAEAPDLDINIIKGGLGKLSAAITNVGRGNATNVEYRITFTGGFIILGKESTGELSRIAPEETFIIESDFILGFGPSLLTISAIPDLGEGSEEKTYDVFVFFIYPYILPDSG